MLDIVIIATLVIAISSLVLSAYVLWVCRLLKSTINSLNNGHTALNESQQGLLDKMRGLEAWLHSVSDRSVHSENRLRSLKRLADIEDATYLAKHMKDESKRYAELSRAYQAKAKDLKKGVQS